MNPPVHVIGANGRCGVALVRALLARGTPVVPVVRDPLRWAEVAPAAPMLLGWPQLADVNDPFGLRRALSGATRIVSTVHARSTALLLQAAPENARLVLLGSTRRFTHWMDSHGLGVIEGEAALMNSGRSGVMLHPTMIYGATGENNVQRLAALLRQLPVVPLPGGGRALVQPIHQDDLTACILAAIDIAWPRPQSLVVAGPSAVPYAALVRAVAAAAGLAPPRLLSLPTWLLMAAAPIVSALPGLPTITEDEVRRLDEDKAFDIQPMRTTLGVHPMSLEDGLARTFQRAA